jgi:8-oxo-dGTP pyrophosphatase MutT (NUDIX family)
MSHIKGYFRKDGVFVADHEDSRSKKYDAKWLAEKGHVIAKPAPAPFLQKGPSQHTLAGFHHMATGDKIEQVKAKLQAPAWASWKPSAPKPPNPHAKPHPRPNDHGEPVTIEYPTRSSGEETWADPDAVATFRPRGATPESLNGVPFTPWIDHPISAAGWDRVAGQDPDLLEIDVDTKGKDLAAGVVIEEPDGRVWVIHPTNAFGGYKRTFPKGHVDDDMTSLQASAIKEAYEESGLQVEITGVLADVARSTTTCRYYTARRVGGTPADMGWESQGASLVPRSRLYAALNRDVDWPLAEKLGAGPAPEPTPKYDWKPLQKAV